MINGQTGAPNVLISNVKTNAQGREEEGRNKAWWGQGLSASAAAFRWKVRQRSRCRPEARGPSEKVDGAASWGWNHAITSKGTQER